MLRIARRLPWLLRRTLLACFEDGLFNMAKGAAYSSLLSLFPVLTAAATIFIQMRADYVQQNLTTLLAQILPPDTETAVLETFRVRGQRPLWILVIAFIVALWAASSVIKSLIDGFNAAYRVPRNRSMLAHTGVGIMLVFLAVIPLAGASSLILFGSVAEPFLLKFFKLDPILNPFAHTVEMLSRITRYVISFVATCSLTAILYFYGPYRKQRWAAVWPGAILATLLWLPATAGFAWYVRNISNYNVLYGSVGTSIALLVWMYLLAAIALFGCEFNAEVERMERAAAAIRRPELKASERPGAS